MAPQSHLVVWLVEAVRLVDALEALEVRLVEAVRLGEALEALEGRPW